MPPQSFRCWNYLDAWFLLFHYSLILSFDFFKLLSELFVMDFISDCIFFSFVNHFYELKSFNFVDYFLLSCFFD